MIGLTLTKSVPDLLLSWQAHEVEVEAGVEAGTGIMSSSVTLRSRMAEGIERRSQKWRRIAEVG